MKIWIDFINTPQVSFWVPFIKEFENEKHELLLTCRDSGNTVALLQLNNLKFQVVGEKAGKGKWQKMLLFLGRLIQLYALIRKNRPDISASQSSFYQPVVSRALGIPSLYTNDNEHAKGNLFGFWFAKKVVLPIAFQNEKFTRKWPLRSKVSFYPSVKEAIYLSQQNGLFSTNGSVKDVIYFRPEPWSAQYYNGPLNFFDEKLVALSSQYKIVVLPRDKKQAEHYKRQRFANLTVAEKPFPLKEIIGNCKLFIGAGGSMTRELAVLGVPVISIYQEEILKVDSYLVGKGCMTINPNISYEEIKKKLEVERAAEKNLYTLEEGVESFKIIKYQIVTLNNKL